MNKRFKEMRKSLHLTQEQIGALIGVNGPAISQIESGRSKPTAAALKLICSTYHISYTWLTEGTGSMMETMDTDALVDKAMPNETELARSIMKAFARLPDAEWIRFRDMIDSIKKEGRP